MVITKASAVVFSVALAATTAVITATATIIILQPASQQQVIAPSAPRTVTYFETHQDEMQTKLAFCNDNPGTALRDAECMNADQASGIVSADQLLSSLRKN